MIDAVIVAVAQYLLFVLAAGVGAAVLLAPARLRWSAAAAGILGLLIAGGLVVVAAKVHSNPRPFVVDPTLRPLFPHSADNGFPSDHSAVAALLAVVGWRVRRWVGVAAAAAAALIAGARVLAHVHHVQDVVAGLVIGIVAGMVAFAVVDLVLRRLLPAATGGQEEWTAAGGPRADRPAGRPQAG